MKSLEQDVRYALRLIKRSPGFTAVAALAIALAIGPTTTLLSVANALLLRTPPGVEKPGKLVTIHASQLATTTFSTFSYPVFERYRETANGLSHVAALDLFPASLAVGGTGEPALAAGFLVSADYFATLGTRPALGRLFREGEDRTPNGDALAVLSYQVWTQRFGADSSVIGRTVNINRTPFTVIGVAEEGFRGHAAGYDVSLWVPISMREAMTGNDLSDAVTGITAVGRIADGSSMQQVDEAARIFSSNLQAEYPDKFENERLTASPYSALLGELKGPVTMFMVFLIAVSCVVLLIASLNVASMLLSRAAGRTREMAVRLAVGAGRRRLVRQLLTESVLLFLLGGGAGTLIACWATRVLAALDLPLPIPMKFDLTPDMRVLAVTLAVVFFAGTLFGLAPAREATRHDLASALKSDVGDVGMRRGRLRNVFVVTQVAGSVVLLTAAGLFMRALSRADSVDLGFDPGGVHVLSVDLGVHRYSPDEARAFYGDLMERADALPAVESAALATALPLGFASYSTVFTLPGREPVLGQGLFRTDINEVSAGYFRTLRIPILEGRPFEESDREGAPRVAVVNHAAAARLWPGHTAVGETIAWGDDIYEIIGVAGDGRYRSLADDGRALVYIALDQRKAVAATLVVRTAAASLPSIGRQIRQIALDLDPDLPVQTNAPYSSIIGLALIPNQAAAWCSLGLGALGLVLALVGLFGLLSYAVALRRREIGVRIALGADTTEINRLIVGRALRLTAAGLAIGWPLAFLVARVVRGVLYGVRAADPVTFAGIAVLFAAVAAVASYLPARRASQTDPMQVLRHE
ncbi:MAG: ABC transporter permease [Gemmatimonadales bacterium]|jgi:predicted permease